MKFEQVPVASAPRGIGLTTLFLDAAPSDFEQALGLKFECIRNHREQADVALLKLENGRFFALAYDYHSPRKGMELIISEISPVPRDDSEDALASLAPMRPPILWKSDQLAWSSWV